MRMFNYILVVLLLLVGGCCGEKHKENRSPIVLTNAMVDSIVQSFVGNHPLSTGDSIVITGGVSWRINWVDNGVVMMTSVEPDSPLMKPVIDNMSKLLGEPFENEEYNLEWSAITYQGIDYKIHLRRVRSEAGGTVVIID